MKQLITSLALAGVALGAAASAQAADSHLLTALSACHNGYFKAVAQDKNIPETLKVREGEFAYLKVEKQPLDVVMFEKPFKDSGLTVTGYVFNDEIIRYVGVPDMHTHFWGLIVKEDWKKAVDKLAGIDWEAVDSRHMSAHANRMIRGNDEKEWKAYTRPANYQYPEMGKTERAFHVQPWNGQTMIFCSMMSAGAPEEAIMADVRPDLLYGEQKVPVREEKIEKDAAAGEAQKLPEGHPKVGGEQKLPEGHPAIDGSTKLPEGHPAIDDSMKLPEGHPKIDGSTKLPEGHPAIGGAKAEPEKK